MAITHLIGWELATPYEAFFNSSPNNAYPGMPASRNGSNASLGVDTAASGFNPSPTRLGSRAAGGALRNLYQSIRFYLRIDVMPSAQALLTILQNGTAPAADATSPELRLNSNGTLRISPDNAVTTATSVNALTADALWHRIDLDVGWNAGAGIRVFVDGVQWASIATGAAAPHAWQMLFAGPAWTGTLYMDDVVCYNSALPAVLGDYALHLFQIMGDSAVGGWRQPDGTTATNLFDVINQYPPPGNTSNSNSIGGHLENAVSSAADNYDANCYPYNDAVPAGETILAVQAICNDAQGVSTGSPKAGALLISANPAQAEQSFDFGLPNGSAGSTSALAMGTFQAGWGTHLGVVTENPVVNRAVGPTVRVGKRTATTREVDIDSLGVYVMYTVTSGLTRPSVKAAGAFAAKPVNVKAAGAFTEKQMNVKVGGAWVNV